jgi:hypothetical protein
MNAVAHERNGSTRSSILLLFCACSFAQVTQNVPLLVAMLIISAPTSRSANWFD